MIARRRRVEFDKLSALIIQQWGDIRKTLVVDPMANTNDYLTVLGRPDDLARTGCGTAI